MNIYTELPTKIPFDYQLLVSLLQGYKYPRDKISLMLSKGEIIRVKKGLYILSKKYSGHTNLNVVANLIYGPSYVSLDSALSYWGLIPERVVVVHSISNRKNKEFKTPIGLFTYKYQNDQVVSVGVELISLKNFSFLMASKEKAVLDKIAITKGLGDDVNFNDLLENDFRIDMYELEQLDKKKVDEYSRSYRKKIIQKFRNWFNKEFL